MICKTLGNLPTIYQSLAGMMAYLDIYGIILWAYGQRVMTVFQSAVLH